MDGEVGRGGCDKGMNGEWRCVVLNGRVVNGGWELAGRRNLNGAEAWQGKA